MSQIFNKIRVGNSKRSTFDLSHDQVTTSDFGQMIPICYRDMVPNDDFEVTPSVFVRLSPLAVPVYGSIKCKISHFFVPYRILYPDWSKFITDSHDNYTTPPYFTIGKMRELLESDPQYKPLASDPVSRGLYCKLMSNLGLSPTCIDSALGDNTRIAAFPFLAYYRIWMDYYMDSNLNDHTNYEFNFKESVESGGSLDSVASTYLQYRNSCFKKDYFTTAKLNPQDGSPSMVGVNLASGSNPGLSNPTATQALQQTASGQIKNSQQSATGATSQVGEFTVEALRGAVSAQRYSERNNYVGSKIINRILAHFGIAPTPERLDMAEYIDSESFPIAIQDVTSHNSVSDLNDNYTTIGLGLQAGKGVGRNARPNTVRYHAKEHGIFMSIMTILPETNYYQGISKFWTKGVTGEPLDYYTPEFENLGYQEILNKEVFVPQFDTMQETYQTYDPQGVFGYAPRYSEYKFAYSVLGSDFAGTSLSDNIGAYLDSWHLFRKFNFSDQNPLALNNNFVTCDNKQEDYDRIFQYTDNKYDHFYFNIRVDVKATRNMIGFAEPSIDSTNMLGDGKTVNLPYGGTRL